MTYDLLLIGDLDILRMQAALASVAQVPVEKVDVGSGWSGDRNWDAPVLCTYEELDGDISYSLDIHLSTVEPAVEELARHLAVELGELILYPAESNPPSAFWLVQPDGSRTRARIEDEDLDDTTLHVIDAVEKPVALLPDVKVELQPEVIWSHRMPTPITEELERLLAADPRILTRNAALTHAMDRLGAWEALTARMATGWPPDGWYPLEYWQDDMVMRDRLAADLEIIPQSVVDPFTAALARVDEAFRAGTREISGVAGEKGWWWRRAPEPAPWSPGR
ncbi:hypothetical protein [Actinoplanes sp. NPDC023714]|uniref:hypothetical protein n=1 Tax=Actinoplanes sp. NPDC023714 TaxID=3154322 RepID=UPI0033D52B48